MNYHDCDDIEKSQKLYNEIFERTKDKDEHISEHLSSIAGILSFYSVIDEKQNFEIFKLSTYGYKIAEKIQNKPFIYFFKGSFLEAIYYKLMKKIRDNDFLQRVVNAQDRGTGSLLKLFQSDDYKNLLEVSKEYSQNIYDSIENKEYWVSLDLLARLIQINLFPYSWLITKQTKEELTPLLENASNLIEYSLKLAKVLGYVEIECEILRHKAWLLHFQNRNEFKEILMSMKTFALAKHLNYSCCSYISIKIGTN